MYMCVVPDASRVIRDRGTPLIDEKSCDLHGQHLEVTSMETLRHYPLENVVFYTQIPYIKTQVMTRMFQFLLTDMGLKFSTSDYLALIERKTPFSLSLSVSLSPSLPPSSKANNGEIVIPVRVKKCADTKATEALIQICVLYT